MNESNAIITLEAANGTDLMILTQLPIIRQRLPELKSYIEQKCNEAISMQCSKETVQSVKTLRADLNKRFREIESKRKEIKKQILASYEEFNAVYKECVSDIFTNADKQLSNKINAVEDELKAEKTENIKAYFDEMKISLNLENVEFEDAKIKINLSDSIKSLKEKCRNFLTKVESDISVIRSLDYSDEILNEYFQSYDLAQAINAVSKRKESIRNIQDKQSNTNGTDGQIKPLKAPKEVTNEKKYKMTFEVTDTLSNLRLLKAYLVDNKIFFKGVKK